MESEGCFLSCTKTRSRSMALIFRSHSEFTLRRTLMLMSTRSRLRDVRQPNASSRSETRRMLAKATPGVVPLTHTSPESHQHKKRFTLPEDRHQPWKRLASALNRTGPCCCSSSVKEGGDAGVCQLQRHAHEVNRLRSRLSY